MKQNIFLLAAITLLQCGSNAASDTVSAAVLLEALSGPAADVTWQEGAAQNNYNPPWASMGFPVTENSIPQAIRASIIPAAAVLGSQDRLWVHAQTGADVESPMKLHSAFFVDGFAPTWGYYAAPGTADTGSVFAATARGVAADSSIGAPVITLQTNGSASIRTCCYNLFGSSLWGPWGSLPASTSAYLGGDLSWYLYVKPVDMAYHWVGNYDSSPTYLAFKDTSKGGKLTVLRRTNSTAWQVVGAAGFTPDAIASVSLYAPKSSSGAGRVHVAALNESGDTVRVYRLGGGGQWTQVGPNLAVPEASITNYLDLAVHYAGNGDATIFVLIGGMMFNSEHQGRVYSIYNASGSPWALSKTLPVNDFCNSIETSTGTQTPALFIGCIRQPDDSFNGLAIVHAGYFDEKNADNTYKFHWYDLGGLGVATGSFPFSIDLAYMPSQNALYAAFSRELSNGSRVVQVMRKLKAHEYCFGGQLGSIVCIGG